MVIEPIFEHELVEHSYGFRPLRSCKLALRTVDECLKAGQTWVVAADMKSYFDTIPHAQLMAEVEKFISDGKVLKLIQTYKENSESVKKIKSERRLKDHVVIAWRR